MKIYQILTIAVISFMAGRNFDISLMPKQVQLKNLVEKSNHEFIGYGGARGGAKMMPLDSLISTPFGFKTHGNIKIGDLVNNPDGSVSKVIQVHQIQQRPLITLKFHDGTEAKCADDHLWNVWRANKSQKKNGVRVFGEGSAKVQETRTIINWVDKAKQQTSKDKRFPLIPVTNEVRFNKTTRHKKTIPAYLLGSLIGDGYLSNSQISITTNDIEAIKEYLSENYQYKISKKNNTDACSFRFVGESFQEIRRELSYLGLLNTKSGNKFIPEFYKYSDIDTRYDLVKGLMDTDGTVDKRGHISFTTISRQLSDDITFVLRSLGAVVTVSEKEAGYKNDEGKYIKCNNAYCLYIKHRTPQRLFGLERKSKLADGGVLDLMFKRIVDYEIGDPVDMRCITVDNPNGLYLTNDFIVTHNSHAIRDLSVLFGIHHKTSVLIFRRIRQELLDNHVYPLLNKYPLLKKHFNKQEMIIFHPHTGEPMITFGYAEHEKDIETFQGKEYALIFVDEATQSTQTMIEFLSTSNRDSKGRFPSKAKMVLTMNPGGVGHAFVKRIFVDKIYQDNEKPENYAFIQAHVWDNVFWVHQQLTKDEYTVKEYYQMWTEEQRMEYCLKHSDYAAKLSYLPEEMRKAHLYGDWEVYGGMFFKTFDKNRQVIKPFEIPMEWPLVAAFDPGYSSPAAFIIGTRDFVGNMYIVATYYEGMTKPKDHAINTRKFCLEPPINQYTLGRIPNPVVSGHDAWAKQDRYAVTSNELTFKDLMEDQGFELVKANTSRVQGWWAIKNMFPELKDQADMGNLFIFDTFNESLVNEIISVETDPRNREDIKGKGNDPEVADHALDAWRYLVMYMQTPLRPQISESLPKYKAREDANIKSDESFNPAEYWKVYE